MNNESFTLHDYYQMQRNYVRSSKSKRSSAIQCTDGKCSNCNRYVGMKFSISRHKEDNSRHFVVVCGGVPDGVDENRRACPLHIELKVPDKDWTPEVIQQVRESLLSQREDIVHFKNRLQFGLDNEDKVSHEFAEALDDLSRQSVLYDGLVQGHTAALNEKRRQQELVQQQTELHEVVLPAYAQLCLKNRTLAAEYYISDVLPKQRVIQRLRYGEQWIEPRLFHKHESHLLIQHVHPSAVYETGDPETALTVVRGIRGATKRRGLANAATNAATNAAAAPKNTTMRKLK
jgi:hypothetical protein